MKIDLVTPRNSSFESSAKDLQKITSKFLDNQKLLKLLKYSTFDALSKPDLTNEEKSAMLNNNIRVVPKLPFNDSQESIVIITFDSFMENGNNPEFRDNIIMIDVLCPVSSWIMGDYMLRPYKIMHEIDGMLNRSKLNGIGKVDFVSANSLILSEELAGFTLVYRVINDV